MVWKEEWLIMKILIVDDEIFAIHGILDGVNWEVLEYDEILQANSYAQAVDILLKTPVEVVLCDIEMPDESGLELIHWIHQHNLDMECIILSCHDEFDFARQAVRLNCLDYILKPVKYDFLTDILRKAGEVVKTKNRQSVLEEYGKIYIDDLSTGKNEDGKDVMEKVADYIDRHLSENLSVKMIANMVYLSPDHLTRSFKKRYNQTVIEYIMQKCMTLAGELLKSHRMTITMVSDTVGFGNYSYFTEQFKKYYGMTPREYQAKERKPS